MPYLHPKAATLAQRLTEPRRFIQVLLGPRQVGKTTLAGQVTAQLAAPVHAASADDPGLETRAWLETQWQIGRTAAQHAGATGALLVLDEIQKVPLWSSTVKRLWDEDTRRKVPLRVLLLGSSPLLVQRGLTESLAGRFEVMRLTHWTLSEMSAAFGFDLEQYLYFGGYPGAAALVADPARWTRYVLDSLIETAVSKDILLMTRIDKPALLRQMFRLGCEYSGQILSLNKMLGQLDDAGNVTTLAHYLDLLNGAGLLTGLQRWSGSAVRQRASSPKLVARNTALMTATSGASEAEWHADPSRWGRVVESAIGAHLVNHAEDANMEVYYWRDANREVDFVLRHGRKVLALEVKSGRPRDRRSGLQAFLDANRSARPLLVGGDGIPIEQFLRAPLGHWFE